VLRVLRAFKVLLALKEYREHKEYKVLLVFKVLKEIKDSRVLKECRVLLVRKERKVFKEHKVYKALKVYRVHKDIKVFKVRKATNMPQQARTVKQSQVLAHLRLLLIQVSHTQPRKLLKLLLMPATLWKAP
jgi:hypothetical protein